MSNLRMRPIGLLLCTLFALPAGAGTGDALQLVARAAYGHDDNLLRVPDGQPAFDGTRADSWWQREGGLFFDRTVGRQRISAVARLSKYEFHHFRQLNHDGKDLQAAWAWQLGSRLDGNIGTAYQQVLAPYTDFVGSERNLNRTRSRFADGGWRLHPSWRVRAGVRRDAHDHALSGQRANDRTERAVEAELDYQPASGSTLGLVARRVRGEYPYVRAVGPFLFDDDFTQDELKARVLWAATGATTVDALAGWTRRDQPAFGRGKTRGITGKIRVAHKPRGKTTIAAALWRDFAPIESTVVSHTLNRGASLGAAWEATAKLRVDANASFERRRYGTRAPFAAAGAIRDTLRTGSLGATWSPRPAVQVAAGVVRQARGGSPVLGTGSFRSHSATLSVDVRF